MNPAKKLTEALEFTRTRIGTSDKLDSVSFTAFLVSLLPIPIVSQSSALLDRLAGDQASRNELAAIWEAIRNTNQKLDSLDDSVEKVQSIVTTVATNSEIERRLDAILTTLLQSLAKSDSTWTVLTKNWSMQRIINTLIQADRASVIALNHSQNELRNTRINARETLLYSDRHSTNLVDGVSFHDGAGCISMGGIRTQGHISVRGSSVGFGPQGVIGFNGAAIGCAPPRQLVMTHESKLPPGVCPKCYAIQAVIQVSANPQAANCENCGASLEA